MERIAALRRFLQNHTLDSVIMLQPENLKYFSGFTGGEGALVLTPSRVILWTDSRYIEQAVDVVLSTGTPCFLCLNMLFP